MTIREIKFDNTFSICILKLMNFMLSLQPLKVKKVIYLVPLCHLTFNDHVFDQMSRSNQQNFSFIHWQSFQIKTARGLTTEIKKKKLKKKSSNAWSEIVAKSFGVILSEVNALSCNVKHFDILLLIVLYVLNLREDWTAVFCFYS